MKTSRLLLTACVLMGAACSSHAAHPTRQPLASEAAPPSRAGDKPPAGLTPPGRAAGSVPATERLTPNVSFAINNVPLAAGGGVSIGLHPTPTPIALHATAAMPLVVCPDVDPASGGTGLSWPPGHHLPECRLLPEGRWVQLPSTHSALDHVAFRVAATRAGTIDSLEVSYERVDRFLVVEASTPTVTAMSVVFTAAGPSTAATLYPDPTGAPVANGVSVSQAGMSIRRTGRCTFLTEETTCFLGLTAGRPVTVRALRAPPSAFSGLDLALP